MRKNIVRLALGAMLFAPCSFADAQQPGKIFRIGLLDPSTASGMRGPLGRVPARDEQAWLDRGKKFYHRVPICEKKALAACRACGGPGSS